VSVARLARHGWRLAQGVLRPDRASYAVFFLTDLCNARCPYCFNTRLGHFAGHPEPADRRGALLSVEEYARVAEGLFPLAQAVFGGGEPFLRPEIDGIAEAFYRKAGVALFSIPTNASLPDAVRDKVWRMAERCPRATFNVQVSLDAAGEKHDRMRALPGGWEKAMSACEALFGLRERFGNVNVVVNTAVTEENLADLPELRARLEERFGARRWLHNVQLDQRADAGVWARPGAEAALALARRAPGAAGAADRFLARWYVGFVDGLIRRQMRAGRMLYACNAGKKLFVMMPDGEVSPCEPFVFDARYARFPRFNVRERGYDFRRVQAEPAWREMTDFIGARKCAACPWSCAAISSLTYTPKNWPLLFSGADRG
jgi:radical SAM protein with 4Fe4S-binding SPASM domain